MTKALFTPKFYQIIIGIIALCIPVVMGFIIWPKIQAIFSDVYIYYEVDGEVFKISIKDYEEFESDLPEAHIYLTVDKKNYCISISQKEEFVNDFGPDNVTLTVLNKNNHPLSRLSKIHRVPGY